jgi:hypothetical protein
MIDVSILVVQTYFKAPVSLGIDFLASYALHVELARADKHNQRQEDKPVYFVSAEVDNAC